MSNEDINKLPDDELIKRIKKGEEEYTEVLIRKYYKMVYTIISKELRDKELAKDLAQEVFLKICQNINKYLESGNFSSWLFSITRNHIIDYIRKNKTRNKYEVKESIDESLVGKKYPNHEKVEVFNYLLEAIEELPPEQNEVVILYYLKRMSVEQIALQLGVPKGTITSRLFLARKKLIKILTNKGINPGLLSS